MDGNPDKLAVRGMSLAIPKGQCFGMLGPNGAGKTSFISMMTGVIPPTSGTAYVYGMDIRTDMNGIYTSLDFCPQHDLLWETLTGKEHLMFYGRLKNLKGAELLKMKARYGATYIFIMTTSSEHEHEVEQLVHRLSPSANKIYHISGTQKFELPKQEVRIADVFHEVESAKHCFNIHTWGLADTTLEDVFIKVAKGAKVFSV